MTGKDGVSKDFVVSADGHLLEPTDLFRTRLPAHLRERGVWEEDFEIEPLVEGGARIFRKLHTPGYEGWTISRYRQTGGRMPEGDPTHILEDMDLDGVDVQVMHPNLSLFGLYSDDHELSLAHARVYNDYVVERFSPYFSRLAPTAPVPLTDVVDARIGSLEAGEDYIAVLTNTGELSDNGNVTQTVSLRIEVNPVPEAAKISHEASKRPSSSWPWPRRSG